MTVEGCDPKELERCINKCVRQSDCDKDDDKCKKKEERKCGKSCNRKCGKTDKPTKSPRTKKPKTDKPTKSPKTDKPTKSPKTDSPTASPTVSPTASPTTSPTASLTESPSDAPTDSITASPSAEPVPTKGLVACGRRTGTCNPYSKKVLPTAFYNVRCCSDTPRTGNFWKKNTQAGCTVWARSDVGGTCSKVTHNGAKKRCAAAGARICTAKEIEDNCTLGSGCQLFNKYVWTQDLVF